MTLPNFVKEWLRENGFEEKINMDRVCVYEKGIFTIHFDNVIKHSETHVRYYKFAPDQSIFSFLVPDNEQDFLTLMKILMKQ